MSLTRSTTIRSLLPALAQSRSRHFSSSIQRRLHVFNADQKKLDECLQVKDKVVLVDFYADWCGPCKVLSPVLEKITSDPSHTDGTPYDLVTVDTDVEVELAQKYKIRSLPTVLAFRDGKYITHFIGALPEPKIKEFLKQL
ncbi:thioredoxin [Sistotremastrum niveocremeum HHB9708]|uniref:Thioredoxin n=2 Tax=Sistotremastraceae TaxID=3402574 RepID=A0A164P614_9AGAM|nr:thioredoxin [Sistotremastrum niveocremeum HHB9708]KZT39685.1 thioredoxin [Sistotremastrum suecicum HHB10207 ss-3]